MAVHFIKLLISGFLVCAALYFLICAMVLFIAGSIQDAISAAAVAIGVLVVANVVWGKR